MNPLSTSLRVARWLARVVGIALVLIAVWALLMPGATAFIAAIVRVPVRCVADASLAASGVPSATSDRYFQNGERQAASLEPVDTTHVDAGSSAIATDSRQSLLLPAFISWSRPLSTSRTNSGSSPARTPLAISPVVPTKLLLDSDTGSQAVQWPVWTMATLIPIVGILIAIGAGLATWVAVRLLRDPRAEMTAVRAMAKASQGGGAWVVSGGLPKLGASSDVVDGWPEQHPT
jgi:hypothetical protein